MFGKGHFVTTKGDDLLIEISDLERKVREQWKIGIEEAGVGSGSHGSHSSEKRAGDPSIRLSAYTDDILQR